MLSFFYSPISHVPYTIVDSVPECDLGVSEKLQPQTELWDLLTLAKNLWFRNIDIVHL